ncbi:hypothetical protein I6M96_19305, partial [Acinetobacter seifertii]|uniref:hypothetical protein n=1 Tax=Acinetobacter seifertii TaxID=1530123 RepID=UPI0018FF13A7
EKLLRLLVDILSNDETKKIKVFFDKDIDLKSYFVKCFENLLLKKSSSNVEKVLSKLILISSVCDWKSGEFLLEKFKEIFVSYQSFQIFETINSFVAFNSKIFKSKDIDFSPYIDLIINLILENKINGFGYGAIQRGGLSNVFNYMSWRKDYSNVELINEFIYFLNSPYNENKDFYSIKVLPYLFYISNEDVKKYIRDYVGSYINGDINEDKFELFLLSIIYDDKFLDSISKENYNRYLA